MFDFDRKPDFINDAGVKWWFDKETTQYAINPDNATGVSLKDVRCWVTEHPDKVKERVLTRGNEVLWAGPALEAIAVHIDMLKATEMFDRKEKK